MGRMEEAAQAPDWTKFAGEAQRIGGLEALAGEREAAALGGQEAALQRAQRAALGEGPSAAQAMMGRGMEQAERAALAGAAEARGPGAALAGRTAQLGQTAAQQAALTDVAALRAQEQLAAMGQEQALATQMRGQGLEAGLGYGQLGLGTREAGAMEKLKQQEQRLQAERGLEESRRGRLGVAKLATGIGATGISALLSGLSDVRAKTAPMGRSRFDWGQVGRTLAGAGEIEEGEAEEQAGAAGAGGVLAKFGRSLISDEDAKQAYKRGLREGQEGDKLPDGGPAIRRVMDTSKPKAYEYKADPGTPHVGPTAQDLAKTPEGAAAVERGPDGLLRVDPGQASLMAMAGAADLHERVSELEKGKPEPSRSRADEAAVLLASEDPSERLRGRMMSLTTAETEEEPRREQRIWGLGDVGTTEGTLAQLGQEYREERPRERAERRYEVGPSPAEIYAEDLRRFRLRQVRDGAVASRPRPMAATPQEWRGDPVLAALGRTV